MEEPNGTPAGFPKGHEPRAMESLLVGLRGSQSTENMNPPVSNRRSGLIVHPYQEEGISVAVESFGVRFGISLADSTLLGEMVDRLPSGWEPVDSAGLANHYIMDRATDAGNRPYCLSDEVQGALGRYDRESLLDAFESNLEDFIAQYASPWIFLHAGVVQWRGKAIVLPGSSFSGKSTLVAALVAAGATYYSDEFAILDPKGVAYAYPRRLTLRAQDGAGWQIRRVNVFDASIHVRPPLPVGLVALLSYDPDRTFRVRTLDQGAAIMALCEHSVAIRRRPADTLAVLRVIAQRAEVFQGNRAEADQAAAWLMERVETPARLPVGPSAMGLA